MYLKSGKVPEIQRQGLDIADIVDLDLKPHLNMCALRYNPTISAQEYVDPIPHLKRA